MSMTLGDFFASATHARPVNPRPVTFTADAKGKVLPGGTPNPTGKPVSATITAAFVFLGGDGAEEARVEARRSLRARFLDDKTELPLPIDPSDFNLELTYQILQRVICQWDPSGKTAGERLFDTVDVLRELMQPVEADRVLGLYNQYVADEHPEKVDDATFRGAQGGGQGLAPRVAGG